MWDLTNFFVDYIQVTDLNDGRWPIKAGTMSLDYDITDPKNPREISTRLGALPLTKSSDAKIYLRITDSMLFLKGNPSKWGRRDNLFGYSFEDCLDIFNNLLHQQGLAPLKNPKLTSIDLTLNVKCGSASQLKSYIRMCRKVKLDRMTTRLMGSGVQYINKSNYLKIYDKAEELRHHNKPKYGNDEQRLEQFLYTNKLADYCELNGVARVELRLFSKWLKNRQIVDVYDVTNEKLKEIFVNKIQPLPTECGDKSVDKFTNMEFFYYLAWREGFDPREKCNRQTFYKYRHAILEKTGGVIDIGNDHVDLDKREKLETFITEALPIPENYVIDKIQRDWDTEHYEEIDEG